LAISRVAHRGGDRRKLPDPNPSSQDLSAKFFNLTPHHHRNTLEIKEIPSRSFFEETQHKGRNGHNGPGWTGGKCIEIPQEPLRNPGEKA